MSDSKLRNIRFPIKKQILSKKKFFYFEGNTLGNGDKKTLKRSELGSSLASTAVRTLKLSLK